MSSGSTQPCAQPSTWIGSSSSPSTRAIQPSLKFCGMERIASSPGPTSSTWRVSSESTTRSRRERETDGCGPTARQRERHRLELLGRLQLEPVLARSQPDPGTAGPHRQLARGGHCPDPALDPGRELDPVDHQRRPEAADRAGPAGAVQRHLQPRRAEPEVTDAEREHVVPGPAERDREAARLQRLEPAVALQVDDALLTVGLRSPRGSGPRRCRPEGSPRSGAAGGAPAARR